MPKYTPAELSRMKAEKDAREMHEATLLRKRQEEARQLQQQQQQRVQQVPNTVRRACFSGRYFPDWGMSI